MTLKMNTTDFVSRETDIKEEVKMLKYIWCKGMLTLISGSSSPRLGRSQRAHNRKDRLNPDLVGTRQCCNTAVRQSDNPGKDV